MADEPNSNEGSNPTDDIKAQNPGATTTADLTSGGEGSDADQVSDDDPDKVQKLTKAGRGEMDPNASAE